MQHSKNLGRILDGIFSFKKYYTYRYTKNFLNGSTPNYNTKEYPNVLLLGFSFLNKSEIRV